MAGENKGDRGSESFEQVPLGVGVERSRRYTREEISTFIAEIAKNLVQSKTTYLHGMLALNELLRLPYAREVLDQDLIAQIQDLWLKIKASGLQLVDPPLLFGESVTLPAEYDLSEASGSSPTDGAG